MPQRFSRDQLVAELVSAGATIKGTKVRCPFHDDRTPSGQIYQAEDTIWRYKCHAASCGFFGDLYDVRARITGKPLAEVLKEANTVSVKTPKPPKVFGSIEDIKATIDGTIEDVSPYTSPTSRKPDLVVIRFRRDGKKSFFQISPDTKGFILKAPPKPWPLFNRIQLQTADKVIVVEGELCVKKLRTAGFAGTTSPAGAGKAAYANWKPLAGKKVYVWPDNDKAGIEHGRQVLDVLGKLEPTPTLFWIEPGKYKLPEGGDVVDFLKGLNSDTHQAAILSVLENAKLVSPAETVDGWYEDVIAGKIKAIAWPWKLIGGLTQALLPKKIILLCGAPGASKSLFLLQCLTYWHQQNIKVAAFELEVDTGFHLRRALAQREENSNLVDAGWVKENEQEVRRVKADSGNRKFLAEFGKCIFAEPNKDVDLDYLLEWVKERGKEGCRIIAIDPVTIASRAGQPWVVDKGFILSLRAIAAKYSASVILVTHPRKTMGGQRATANLDALAGGAAYQRFTDTILWLQSFPDWREFKIATPVATSTFKVNRAIRILKANDGKGAGTGIAFKFYAESLKLGEQGVVISENKKKDL